MTTDICQASTGKNVWQRFKMSGRELKSGTTKIIFAITELAWAIELVQLLAALMLSTQNHINADKLTNKCLMSWHRRASIESLNTGALLLQELWQLRVQIIISKCNAKYIYRHYQNWSNLCRHWKNENSKHPIIISIWFKVSKVKTLNVAMQSMRLVNTRPSQFLSNIK